jgi:hypothetical protein
MTESYRTISTAELLTTEIGISGAQLPTNGPGRKNPLLKYIIVGGIIIGAVVIALHLHKQSFQKVIPRKNED